MKNTAYDKLTREELIALLQAKTPRSDYRAEAYQALIKKYDVPMGQLGDFVETLYVLSSTNADDAERYRTTIKNYNVVSGQLTAYIARLKRSSELSTRDQNYASSYRTVLEKTGIAVGGVAARIKELEDGFYADTQDAASYRRLVTKTGVSGEELIDHCKSIEIKVRKRIAVEILRKTASDPK